MMKSPFLAGLAVLAALQVARVAGAEDEARLDMAIPTADDIVTPYEDTAWPWEKDREFRVKRVQAIKRLTEYGDLRYRGGGYSSSSREEPDPYQLFREFEGKPTHSAFAETLIYLPELRWMYLTVDDLSADGFGELSRLKYLERLRLTSSDHRLQEKVEVTAESLQHVARCLGLVELRLRGCRVTDEELKAIARLGNLRILDLSGTHVTSACFRAIAELPQVENVSIHYADLNQPIDEKTHKAIASLNGRLRWLDFDEWGSTPLHPTILPAIAEIRSLEWLAIGEVPGAGKEEFEPLKILTNLRQYQGIHGSALDALIYARANARNPLFTVLEGTEAEIEVFLENLLGPEETNRIRGATRRRKLGQAEPQNFVDSKAGLEEILRDSFGVQVSLRVRMVLDNLAHGDPRMDPKLNELLRKYLSGLPFE